MMGLEEEVEHCVQQWAREIALQLSRDEEGEPPETEEPPPRRPN